MSEQSSITEEEEQKALEGWRRWCHVSWPTIAEASTQADVTARDTVGGLTTTQVILLLQEHGDWTHRPLRGPFENEQYGVSIGTLARRHLVQHRGASDPEQRATSGLCPG